VQRLLPEGSVFTNILTIWKNATLPSVRERYLVSGYDLRHAFLFTLSAQQSLQKKANWS
jgi:hypothetical protein